MSKNWNDAMNSLNSVITFKEGINVIHLTTPEYWECYEHYGVEDKEGNKRRVVCLGGLEGRGNSPKKCPVCAMAQDEPDLSGKHTYYLSAVDGALEKIKDADGNVKYKISLGNVPKRLRVGIGLFKAIARIHLDPEEEAIDKVTLKIVRTGTGMKTRYDEVKCFKANPPLPPLVSPVPDLAAYTTPDRAATLELLGLSEEDAGEAAAEKTEKKGKGKKEKEKKKEEPAAGDVEPTETITNKPTETKDEDGLDKVSSSDDDLFIE